MHRSVFRRAAAAALLVAVLAAAPAQAALVQFRIDGSATFADAGNAFGLDISDPVSITGSLDDSLIPVSGDGDVVFGDGSGNLLSVVIGLMTWTQAMDLDFAAGTGPLLQFLDGLLVGIFFSSDSGTNGAPAWLLIAAGGWDAEDADENLAGGLFDLESFETWPAPAPASLPLLLGGWLLLWRQRARRGRAA